MWDCDEIGNLLIHQLKSFWADIDDGLIRRYIPEALELVRNEFKDIESRRFSKDGDAFFNPYFSTHWVIFLYRLSHLIYQMGGGITADQIYYLNKIMHSVDWYSAISLPKHFLCEHPVGSVLGRAHYGDWLFVYQGTTIGGNRRNGSVFYPTIGNNVILFSNSSVLGNSVIGDNVMISSGCRVLNELIPSNSVVFGQSPNLTIKCIEHEIISKIKEYWK